MYQSAPQTKHRLLVYLLLVFNIKNVLEFRDKIDVILCEFDRLNGYAEYVSR